jgi:hypothetical protein
VTVLADTVTAVAHLGSALDRLERSVLQLFEVMTSRSLTEGLGTPVGDPAILQDPRVRAAGIRLEDVNLGRGAAAAPVAEPGEAEDPQDRLDRLAQEWAADHGGELADGYRAVSREDPGLWLAAREAAYLDGSRPQGVQ